MFSHNAFLPWHKSKLNVAFKWLQTSNLFLAVLSSSIEACGKWVAWVCNSECHYLLTVVHHPPKIYCISLKECLGFLNSFDHCDMKWGLDACQESDRSELNDVTSPVLMLVELQKTRDFHCLQSDSLECWTFFQRWQLKCQISEVLNRNELVIHVQQMVYWCKILILYFSRCLKG